MLEQTKNYFRLVAEGRENRKLSKIFFPVLILASWIYGGINRTVRFCYEKNILKRRRFPFPVISVGNLTWGGTGKTPLVEYLAHYVSRQRRTPLVLTRGYSHDEASQFKRHLPRALVGVGRNRVAVAEEMMQKHHIDVAILDDGLQHWPIVRDLEIVTVSALNPFGNEKLIPHGILREPLNILTKVQIVVITHVNLVTADRLQELRERISQLAPQACLVESYLEPLFFYRPSKKKRVPLNRLQQTCVTTFSGVGAPRSFQLLLMRLQIKPMRNFEYPDHHVFRAEELREIKAVSEAAGFKQIITTEKDFYRTPDLIANILDPLILAVRLRILRGEEYLTEYLLKALGVTRR